MKLPLFTDTIHCSSRRERGACKVCRSSRRFREQLAQSFSLPDDDPDFDCPHGVEWINKPKATDEAKPQRKPYVAPRPRRSRGLGDTIAKATKAMGIKPCGGCKQRQAALNKLVPYKHDDDAATTSAPDAEGRANGTT